MPVALSQTADQTPSESLAQILAHRPTMHNFSTATGLENVARKLEGDSYFVCDLQVHGVQGCADLRNDIARQHFAAELIALGLALYFASQGAGHMVWPVISSLSRMAVALIGALILMQTGGLGLRGIFIAIGGAMAVYGSVIGLAIWRKGWRARA